MEQLFNVSANKTLGRYLTAKRDIKPGEIIIKEMPKLLGSQIAAFPICFKCATRLYTRTPPPCGECGLAPTCGQCSGTLHKQECNYMKEIRGNNGLTLRFLCENPQISLPLRCFLMKFYDPLAWHEFLKLESHLKERRGTYIYNLHKFQVDKPLREAKIMPDLNLDDEKDKETFPTICGILDVNTFEVRPNQQFIGPEDCLRGLYMKPALMAHDCLSNTHLSVDDNFLMTIRASLAIKTGEMITFNYTNSLQGNAERQKHLQEGKYFTCSCKRCLDPTELSTGMSTLICTKCKNATVTRKQDQWTCPDCQKTYASAMISTTLALAKEKTQRVLETGTLRDAMQLVNTLQRTLHAQHGLIIEIKQKIITLLTQQQDIPSTLQKIALCAELLEVLKVLEPGISRHQGIAQYELHNAQILLGKLQYNSSQITLDNYLQVLKDAETVLREAIGHLIYEPKCAPEGRLAQRALTDLQVLRATIKDVGAKIQRKAKKHK